MNHIISIHKKEMSQNLYHKFGEYRYKIFIEKLRWNLPGNSYDNREEFDQYDTLQTKYIIGLDDRGDIFGCARLLPTSGHYLLKDIFSSLSSQPLPSTSNDFEISRFAATSQFDHHLAMRVFGFTLYAAQNLGASNAFAVTTVALERYFLKNEVILTRLGKPVRYGRNKIIALCFPTRQAGPLISIHSASHS